MQQFKIWLSVILIALVITFVLQNIELVEFKLVFWTVSLPRSLVVFTVLFIGIILGWSWRRENA